MRRRRACQCRRSRLWSRRHTGPISKTNGATCWRISCRSFHRSRAFGRNCQRCSTGLRGVWFAKSWHPHHKRVSKPMIHGPRPRQPGPGAKVSRSSHFVSRGPTIFAWIWAMAIQSDGSSHMHSVARKLARFCSAQSRFRHANRARIAWIASSPSKSRTNHFDPAFRIEITGSGHLPVPQLARRTPTQPFRAVSTFRGPKMVYIIKCTSCGKEFKRSKADHTLRPHKGRGGWQCPSLTGYLVRTSYE